MSNTRRYRTPFVLLALASVVVAVVSAASVGFRNRQRDEILRKRYASIAASRGITIVDQPLLVLRGYSRPVNPV